MGRKHPCACDTIRILLGGDCQRRGESLSACDTRGAFLGAGSRCVQRCAHGRYRQPRPLGKFKGESWAGIPYPLRQINAGEHDWGAVNIIKRFLWSNNSKRSNKNPNWNFGMETRRNLQRGCNNLSLFFADFS